MLIGGIIGWLLSDGCPGVVPAGVLLGRGRLYLFRALSAPIAIGTSIAPSFASSTSPVVRATFAVASGAAINRKLLQSGKRRRRTQRVLGRSFFRTLLSHASLGVVPAGVLLGRDRLYLFRALSAAIAIGTSIDIAASFATSASPVVGATFTVASGAASTAGLLKPSRRRRCS